MSEQTTILSPDQIQDPGFFGGIVDDALVTWNGIIQDSPEIISNSIGALGSVNPFDPFGLISSASSSSQGILDETTQTVQGATYALASGFGKSLGLMLGLAVLLGGAYLVFTHREAR